MEHISNGYKSPAPELMSAGSLSKDDVYSTKGEKLGAVKDFMLNMRDGRVSYAVLSFGGTLGFGQKLFAVPWDALKLDTVNKRFELDVDKQRLESAPGFDKDDWPDMADQTWANGIHSYYGTSPQVKGNSPRL